MTDFWNAKIYNQFREFRARPIHDLLSVIPDSFQPKAIYDLGCGPGNSTIIIKKRWPQAKIIGLDSSLAMLEEAKASYPDITFITGDIENFFPSEKIDGFFANASLQYVKNHEILFPKLLDFLNPGGVFGIQMPNNFHSAAHQITIKLLQNNKAWRPFLKNLRYGTLTEPFYHLPWYYDLLTQSGACSLQLWETEYLHEMSGCQDIFDYVRGTALRPVLTVMDEENQTAFTEAYLSQIAKEYPLQVNRKILLSMRRIFMVGKKICSPDDFVGRENVALNA